MFPLERLTSKLRIAAITAALTTTAAIVIRSSIACGPDFPNQVIANGDSGILAMPMADFTEEIDRLRPPQLPPQAPLHSFPGSFSVFTDSSEADEADLQSALKNEGVVAAQATGIGKRYALLRNEVTAHSVAVAENRDWYSAHPKTVDPIKTAMPEGLPMEFRDYIVGLIAYDNGDVTTARAQWKDLLSLPVAARKYHSTWAAFMLGKSYLTENPQAAREWFAKTRELASAGFTDSLDLASSSLGWEAKTELNAGHISSAMSLYLRQHWTGDSTALVSLRETAHAALDAGVGQLPLIAKDEQARAVITACILSDHGQYAILGNAEMNRIPAWLAATDAAQVKPIAGADRLAWLAYRTGDFAMAASWANRADAAASITQWVQAKLYLRDGKVNAAVAILARLVKSFPQDKQWLSDQGNGMDYGDPTVSNKAGADSIIGPVAGDLAALRLARGEYADSLDMLLKSDYWMDAAYVAERILTVDELKAFVNKHYPQAATDKAAVDPFFVNSNNNVTAEARSLRYLLARRLARADRWAEARPYFPAEMQSTADEFAAAVEFARRDVGAKDKRAGAFLSAARIAHSKGMELLGTELEPDFYCYGGQFSLAVSESNLKRGRSDSITGPSSDELARYSENAPDGLPRFHYRYVAAELAWAATKLMPDDTDEKAAALYEAGSWIKNQYPKMADRFYKSLVLQCPNTKLGKAAAAAHWFPATRPAQ